MHVVEQRVHRAPTVGTVQVKEDHDVRKGKPPFAKVNVPPKADFRVGLQYITLSALFSARISRWYVVETQI